MKKQNTILLSLIILLVLTISSMTTTYSQSGVGFQEDMPHARVVVTRVDDGDTFHISPPIRIQGAYRSVVRLADIDSPELGQPGGDISRGALVDLLKNHSNIVLLDIDRNTIDPYGRIIAVAYVRVNSTYILNVNKWMLDKGYASKSDTENVFDPDKWSLYLEYPVENEKLPEINKTTIYTGWITNAMTWGVRIAVTPDRKYMAIAFSEGEPNWTLRVVVIDNNGTIVNNTAYSPDLGSSWYGNVFRGMIDIAANETGFMVTWTNFTRTGTSRVVLYSYIPVTGPATMPTHIFTASYQYHPVVTFYVHSNGTRWWIIGYGRQTTAIANYTMNLINITGAYTGRFSHTVLAPGADAGYRIGVDVMGKLIFDPRTNRSIVITRNYTAVTGHDLIAIVAKPHATLGFDLDRFNVDNRTGDQGPEPDIYDTRFSYYNVYPMHTALLGSGRYVLTVYNENSSSLAYAIVDLDTYSVSRGTLFDYGTSVTFYPWIASNDTHWMVVWNAVGWANVSFMTPTSRVLDLTLATHNASFVRVAFDKGSGKFIVPYAITDHTETRNLFIVFYDTVNDALDPWILPVNTTPGVHETPLHVAILRGSDETGPGRIAIVALEGGSLVVYLVSESYPQLQYPLPIPEPVIVAAVTTTLGSALLYVALKKRRSW